MFLTKLDLAGFRNLSSQSVSFSEPLTVISGLNGHGKTSILEAIYLLSHNRSFRPGKLKDALQWHGPGRARISAILRSDVGERELTVEITPSGRRVTINGKSLARFSEFFGQAQVVAFTPETLQIVKGPPQQRRTFLDRVLAMVDPGFVESAMYYHRAVKQRNALLHQSTDLEAVAPWDELLIRYGMDVTRHRVAFEKFMREAVPRHYRSLAKASAEQVSVSYTGDFLNSDGSVFSTEELREKLVERFHRDQRVKSTTFGPHHDDLELFLSFPGDESATKHDARTASSQGQARSLALALNYSAIDYLEQRTGDHPIVLLDDVESELDRTRRESLVSGILSRGNQVFITSTEGESAMISTAGRAQHLRVHDGTVDSSGG